MKNRTAVGCWGWLAGLGSGLAAHPGAHGAIVAMPDPGIPAEVGVRVRNGGTGVEAMIFDNQRPLAGPLPWLGTVPEPAGTLPVLGAAMVLLSRRRPA